MSTESKPLLFSGIQPSGEFTIGNYFGAIANWVRLQDSNECVYCVVDLHAITVPQDPAVLRERTLGCAATLIACGVDPEKSLLFVQSHVHEHAELAWILNCSTHMGELSRMTQFKDKSSKTKEDSVGVGLFDYPVLMAADILIYKSKLVPVGEDQRQHLELARDIAVRFNATYGETFPVPEGYIPKEGAKILSLQDPSKKMSKSDPNAGAYVLLLDPPDTVRAKFKRAVTDSGSRVEHDPAAKPGISNLMEIYACALGRTLAQVSPELEGMRYGDFKTRVGDAVAELLIPIQKERERLLADRSYLYSVLSRSAAEAGEIAAATKREVYGKVGFYVPEE